MRVKCLGLLEDRVLGVGDDPDCAKNRERQAVIDLINVTDLQAPLLTTDIFDRQARSFKAFIAAAV
jgi:hypothetical protein